MIADDHSYLIEGVKQLLLQSNINVIGYTLDVHDVIPMYMSLKPDILLCDIMFQMKMHGIDVVADLLKMEPGAKVILFSQYEQDEVIAKAYEVGAKAFLKKSIDAQDLIKVIAAVHDGELYFDSAVAVQLAQFMVKNKSGKVNLDLILDEREKAVLGYLGDGLTENEISEKMDIARRTVSNIKNSLKEKLKIHKPASFTKLAIQHGLTKIDDVD